MRVKGSDVVRGLRAGTRLVIVALVAVVALRVFAGYRQGTFVRAAIRGPAASEPASAQPQVAQPPATAGVDSSRAWEHLRQMVAMGPRPAGSAALRQTRAYITRQLSSIGLTVQEQPFIAQTPVGKVEMVNLIVTLPGHRSDRILITGHYDTKIERGFAFVGASDAASSAAFLIEFARALRARPLEFTYELVWFDGEEAVCEGWSECGTPGSPDNTYGSRYYVQAAKAANAVKSIKAMVLLDMIGARDLKLRRDGYSAPWLNDMLWAHAARLGYSSTFLSVEAGKIEDDHVAFVEAGVPSVDLIDLADYPQWHTAQDDLDHVAAQSLQIVGDVLLAALPDIERHVTASPRGAASPDRGTSPGAPGFPAR